MAYNMRKNMFLEGPRFSRAEITAIWPDIEIESLERLGWLNVWQAYAAIWETHFPDGYSDDLWQTWALSDDEDNPPTQKDPKPFLNCLFASAFRKGSLTGFVFIDDEPNQIPLWYWDEAQRSLKTITSRWAGFDYRLPQSLRNLSEKPLFVKSGDFDKFAIDLDNDKFSAVPVGIDDIIKKQLSYETSRSLPDAPFVEICQATSWLAFGHALSAKEIQISKAYDSHLTGEGMQAILTLLRSQSPSSIQSSS